MDEFAKQRQTKGSRPGAAGNTAGGGGFAKETGASAEDLTGGGVSSGSGGSQGGFKRRQRSYVPVKGNVIMGSSRVTVRALSIGQVNSESGSRRA